MQIFVVCFKRLAGAIQWESVWLAERELHNIDWYESSTSQSENLQFDQKGDIIKGFQ